MEEIYKDIEGYAGLYQISNHGNVKSFHTSKEKILKPVKDKDGYLFVGLYKQGKHKKHYKVHRLVAKAFIENPDNLPVVNHKDEDKTNNKVDNLEYCTAEYNINYGTRNQRISKRVLCIETGKIYQSGKQVERELGFFSSYISSACNGKLKQAYGYTWRYV